jgi:hypothetical protein
MRSLPLAVTIAVALLAGCGMVKKLENRKVLAGLVMRSPDLVVGAPANLTVSGVVTVQVFFGDLQGDTQAPTGLADAAVTLSWAGGATGSVTLPAGPSAGWYQLTGTSVAHQAGLTYTFTVRYGGEVFTGTVVAPAAEGITELAAATPPLIFPPTPNPAATFTKQTVSRTGSDTAVYAANPIEGPTSLGPTSCTNAPLSDAWAMVQLLIAAGPWTVPSFELWRTNLAPTASQRCFAPGPGAWVVTLTTVRSGSVSGNLFLGSGVLAGSADAGVLVLQ